MMRLFRRRREVPLTSGADGTHARVDISTGLQLITWARAGTGVPIPYDELPVTQGLASLYSDAIADMELFAFDVEAARRRRAAGATRADAARAAALTVQPNILERPDPDEDREDTLAKITQSLYWTGNAVAEIGPGNDSIVVLNPIDVHPYAQPSDPLRVDHWYVYGRKRDADTIVHWKWNDDPRRGPVGESPLVRCSAALETYGWAYRYLLDFFAGGGNPGSIIKSQFELSPAQLTEHVTEWIAARQQRRPAFFPPHLTFEVPPTSGELAATLEVLGACAAEIARMLNVPTSLVNAPVTGYSLTYSNVRDEFVRWRALSLGTTWSARIARGFSRLLPAGQAAWLDAGGLFDEQPAAEPAADRIDQEQQA